MFCSNCGNEIGDDMAFCPKCGTAAGDESYEDETDYTEDDTVKVSKNKKSGLFRNNKGGLIVAIIANVFLLYNYFTAESEIAFSLPAIIIGAPFSLFTGCIGWAIAKKLKQHFAPDVVYYTKTSSLIATKLWWGGGIHIVCSFIGALIPIGIVAVL